MKDSNHRTRPDFEAWQRVADYAETKRLKVASVHVELRDGMPVFATEFFQVGMTPAEEHKYAQENDFGTAALWNGEDLNDATVLRPCPFCGSENVDWETPDGCSPTCHAVVCHECEATGPLKSDQASAVEAWNYQTCRKPHPATRVAKHLRRWAEENADNPDMFVD